MCYDRDGGDEITMKTILVRVNGALAEALGTSRLAVQLPEQATAGDLVADLGHRHPATGDILTRAVVVTGGKHIAPSTILSDNQEVALLMPISGG